MTLTLQQLFYRTVSPSTEFRSNRTAATASLFKYLEAAEGAEESLVDQNSASWNPLIRWMRQIERLRAAAWRGCKSPSPVQSTRCVDRRFDIVYYTVVFIATQ